MPSVSTYNIKALIRALASQTSELRKSKSELARLNSEFIELKRRSANLRQDPKSPEKGHDRKKAAVICWDVGHNPAGRGLVLYELLEQNFETTLVGPSWSRYGRGLWPPLSDLGLRTDIFCCNDLADFLPQAMVAATRTKYDLVYVSKPRLPSLYIGFLIKQISHCPLILDIDDHELSFFPDQKSATITELRAGGRPALLEPYQGLSTQFCESLIPHADAITVSNIALRSRYGGTIVRHARNESQFDPMLFDRDAVRAELGIARDEFNFLFVGTPRAHKGIFELAEALKTVNDRQISFHIVGDSGDRSVSNKIASYAQYRVRHHANRSFADLPRLLSAADCVPLIQDPDHPISQYQIPAKISDALALGVPILLSDVPPVRDLLSRPGIVVAKKGELGQAVRRLKGREAQIDRDDIRSSFLDEFSNTVNGARLSLAIKQAQTRAKPVPDLFVQVQKELRAAFSESVKSAITASFRIPTVVPKEHTFDVALFWKQNDSGVYGRRSDMIAKHLIKSGRVRRLMYFDAPIKDSDLLSIQSTAAKQPRGEKGLVLRNTLGKWLDRMDDGRVFQRTFISGTNPHNGSAPYPLRQADEYVSFVEDELLAAGFIPSKTVAWVFPVSWDFPKIAESLKFRSIVADIVDDQRAWNIQERYRERLNANYKDILSKAEIVFTNCDPVKDAFANFGKDIHVVPNGTEIPSKEDAIDGCLKGLSRPIIGYVGNMRDRIDWTLIEACAVARPKWNFVFAGSTENSPQIEGLRKYKNIHFVGVIEYPRLHSLLRGFDVAIIPHLATNLTERMNPLKAYNYVASGLPIVMTNIANLAELKSTATIATTPETFIAAIESALAKPRISQDDAQRSSLLKSISWDTRINEMLRIVGEHGLYRH